jgi:hypothetical protein
VITDQEVYIGDFMDLAFIGDCPLVAFSSFTFGEEDRNSISVTKAIDAAGSSWGTPVVAVADCGLMGGWPDLEIIAGNPAISYFDQEHGEVRYTRADDPDGTHWPDPMTIGSNVGVFGGNNSLRTVAGFPAIAYSDGSRVWYRRASDTLGTEWLEPVAVDTGEIMGYPLAMTVIGEQPAISYFAGGGNLKFAMLRDSTGHTGYSIYMPPCLDDTFGFSMSAKLVNGLPAIACGGMYVSAQDDTGANWNEPVDFSYGEWIIDSVGIAFFRGAPVYLENLGDLYLIAANNASGSDWYARQSVSHTNSDTYVVVLVHNDKLCLLFDNKYMTIW